MSKSKHVLLSIVTLGIYPLYIRSKAKKIANTSRDNISVSTKALININDFINDLGGITTLLHVAALFPLSKLL